MRLIICIFPVLVAVQILSSCTTDAISPNEELWQRARTACEQVGLKPGTSEVGDCATNLQAALNNSSSL